MLVPAPGAAAALSKCVPGESALSHSQLRCTSDAGRVVALRQFVIALNGGGTHLDSTVDSVAALEMRVIGAGDATWNAANPRWKPLFNRIRSDLKRDLRPAAEAQASATASLWDRELAAHLSAARIDTLLGFFRSPAGRRYLALQQRLNALESGAISGMFSGLAGGGSTVGTIPPAPPASRAVLQQRKHLLELCWARLTFPILGAASDKRPRVDSVAFGSLWDNSMQLVATTKGPVVDRLQRQYGADLPRFAAFERSPAAVELLAVYGAAVKESMIHANDAGNPLGAALRRSVARHAAAWKAAYRAAQSSAPTNRAASRSSEASAPSLEPGAVPPGTITTAEPWKKGGIVRRLAALPNAPFVNGLAFSPDGSQLAVATATRINIWSVHSGRVLHTLADDIGLSLAARTLRFSPNGRYLATCQARSWQGGVIVRIWSTRTWSYVRGIKGPHGCESIAFTPDSRSMLVAETTIGLPSDESLVAYDTRTWLKVWAIRTGSFYVHTLAVSPSGTLAAIGGRVLNPSTPDRNAPTPTFGTPPLPDMFLIAIVDLRTHELLRTIRHTVDEGFGNLAWRPDAPILATIGTQAPDDRDMDGDADALEIFNVDTGQRIALEMLNKPGHPSVCYTRDGKYLIESDFTGVGVGWGLRIWTGNHGSLVHVLRGDFGDLACSSNGHLFATSNEGWVSIFELR
jgi:hypothetical protein